MHESTAQYCAELGLAAPVISYNGAMVRHSQTHEVWQHLPRPVQETVIAKEIKVYAINAYAVAKENQLGNRINTIMQTCFFELSGVLPRAEAIVKIKESIRKR